MRISAGLGFDSPRVHPATVAADALHSRRMRYQLQYKALPKDDEEDELDEETTDEEVPVDEPTDPPEDDAEGEEEPPADDAAAEEPPSEDEGEFDDAEDLGEPEADDPAAPDDVNKPQPFAGDVYNEGDETDPAASFAHLQGPDGTEAWLDHEPDGTMTGWVRTPNGTVYRYSDPAAWAIDADEAGLKRIGGTMAAAAEGEEPPADDETGDGTGGGAPVDDGVVDEESDHLDNRNKRFAFEGKSYEINYF